MRRKQHWTTKIWLETVIKIIVQYRNGCYDNGHIFENSCVKSEKYFNLQIKIESVLYKT